MAIWNVGVHELRPPEIKGGSIDSTAPNVYSMYLHFSPSQSPDRVFVHADASGVGDTLRKSPPGLSTGSPSDVSRLIELSEPVSKRITGKNRNSILYGMKSTHDDDKNANLIEACLQTN